MGGKMSPRRRDKGGRRRSSSSSAAPPLPLPLTFHLRLARKRLILSLFRDLVVLRVRGVKETIQGCSRASVHDSRHLGSHGHGDVEVGGRGGLKKKTKKPSNVASSLVSSAAFQEKK